MLNEIVGSSRERLTTNSADEAVGGFLVFLATRISHSIYASQVSSYVVRPVLIILNMYAKNLFLDINLIFM
jgi:hypothetical protein